MPSSVCCGSPEHWARRSRDRDSRYRSAQEDHIWAQAILSEVRSPRIILNVGTRWSTKRWPPEHFAEVACRAVAEFGAGLVAVGSADDQPFVDELARHLGPVPLLDLCGRTRLLQLAALSVESDLLIANDTGPLHLAAAVRAQVVGIFTCSDPRLTGPYGPRAVTVQTRVKCAGSRRRRCDRVDCFIELTPARVWAVISQQLRASARHPFPPERGIVPAQLLRGHDRARSARSSASCWRPEVLNFGLAGAGFAEIRGDLWATPF